MGKDEWGKPLQRMGASPCNIMENEWGKPLAKNERGKPHGNEWGKPLANMNGASPMEGIAWDKRKN